MIGNRVIEHKKKPDSSILENTLFYKCSEWIRY